MVSAASDITKNQYTHMTTNFNLMSQISVWGHYINKLATDCRHSTSHLLSLNYLVYQEKKFIYYFASLTYQAE